MPDFVQGICRAVALSARTADVQLAASPSLLEDVPLARHITSLVTGDIVLVMLPAPDRPAPDALLVAVLGPGSPVGARAYNSGGINHTLTAQWVALALDSERFDTDAMHSLTSNPSRLTCRTPGLYTMSGHLSFNPHATGYRQVGLRLNGSTFLAISAAQNIGAGANLNLSVATLYQLAVGDYVELYAWQNSGGTLTLLAGAAYSPELATILIS